MFKYNHRITKGSFDRGFYLELVGVISFERLDYNAILLDVLLNSSIHSKIIIHG